MENDDNKKEVVEQKTKQESKTDEELLTNRRGSSNWELRRRTPTVHMPCRGKVSCSV